MEIVVSGREVIKTFKKSASICCFNEGIRRPSGRRSQFISHVPDPIAISAEPFGRQDLAMEKRITGHDASMRQVNSLNK